MKTDDQLIEDFYISQGGKPHDPADLWFYSSSWDMLMPVVLKISLINPSICNNYLLAIAKYKAATMLPISTEIEIVYKAVVDFIKWYNELATTNREEI